MLNLVFFEYFESRKKKIAVKKLALGNFLKFFEISLDFILEEFIYWSVKFATLHNEKRPEFVKKIK